MASTGSSVNSRNGGSVDEIRESIRDKATDLKDDVAGVARAARDSAQHQWEKIQSTTREQTKHLVEVIKDRPLTSVGVAVGAGLILGALMRR